MRICGGEEISALADSINFLSWRVYKTRNTHLLARLFRAHESRRLSTVNSVSAPSSSPGRRTATAHFWCMSHLPRNTIVLLMLSVRLRETIPATQQDMTRRDSPAAARMQPGRWEVTSRTRYARSTIVTCLPLTHSRATTRSREALISPIMVSMVADRAESPQFEVPKGL